MDFYVNISVYSSAFDHKGRVMPLAKFMNLGKDYADSILEYRTLKEAYLDKLDAIDAARRYADELQSDIDGNENPMGGEDTTEIIALKSQLAEVCDTISTLLRTADEFKHRSDDIKRKFPCATLSGQFAPTRGKGNIVHHSGFICVDIDDHYTLTDSNGQKHSYRQDLVGVANVLRLIPWVCYAAHSVGGRGYYALIPLGPIDDTHTHEWYFDCLKADFEKYGIVIDPACRDTTRLRILSYDDAPIRNSAAVPYTGQQRFVSRNERNRQRATLQAEHEAAIRRQLQYGSNADDPEKDFDHIVICTNEVMRRGTFSAINGYKEWIALGMALATIYGERGRVIFDNLSSCANGYNSDEVCKKYDNFLRRATPAEGKVPTIKTIFKLFHQEGIFWWKLIKK